MERQRKTKGGGGGVERERGGGERERERERVYNVITSQSVSSIFPCSLKDTQFHFVLLIVAITQLPGSTRSRT